MTPAELLVDAFERVRGVVEATVDGLTPEQLAARPAGNGNSIAWLVWHLTRVQDTHLAAAFGTEQVWTAEGWFDRFRLPFAPGATGYGQTAADVAAVHVSSGDLLCGYLNAVHARTVAHVSRLVDADLTRIVDESWDPPVTLGARLISVIADDLQHAGQAAYVRGLVAGPPSH